MICIKVIEPDNHTCIWNCIFQCFTRMVDYSGIQQLIIHQLHLIFVYLSTSQQKFYNIYSYKLKTTFTVGISRLKQISAINSTQYANVVNWSNLEYLKCMYICPLCNSEQCATNWFFIFWGYYIFIGKSKKFFWFRYTWEIMLPIHMYPIFQ